MTLSGLETALVSVFLLLLMFGMGATLDVEQFRRVARRPAWLAIGLASQFGWMPLIGVVLAKSLALAPETAIGLVVMACSSGGTTSNFFSYLSRADLALSISMTVASTIAGVVLIPLALAITTAPFTTPDLAIPYANVVTTLVAVLVPVALGIWLRSRSVRWARRAERFGSAAGFAVLALVIAGNLAREGQRLLEIGAGTWAAATLLGPAGFGFGWAGARALGLAAAQRRAVSLETGIQNAPLAIGIVLLSFEGAVREQVLVAPLLYGVIVVPCSALAALLFRRRARAEAQPGARSR